MGFLSNALIQKGVSAGFSAMKFTVGGVGNRALVGGFIGGIYGAASSDRQDPTNFLSDIATGAVGGAFIGGASRAITPAWSKGGGFRGPMMSKQMGQIANQFNPFNKKGALTKGGPKAMQAAEFAMEYPVAALGIVGVGALMLGQTSSPDSSNFNDSTLANNAVPMSTSGIMSSSIAPTGGITGGMAIRHHSMLNSTYGLVQGMHGSRH